MVYQVLSDKVQEKHYGTILNTICVVVLAQTILMVLNSFGIWFLTIPKGIVANVIPKILHIDLGFNKYVTCGLVSNINMAGIFLALGLPAFFRKKWCWLIPLIFCGIVIGKSLGGILPAFIISITFLFIRFKQYRWKVVSLTLLGIIFLLLRSDFQYMLTKGDVRIDAWKGIWKYIIIKKPIVGIGVGQFHEAFPLIQKYFGGFGKNWTLAHNEYLQLWAEQGLIGLSLALGFMGSLFYKIPKTIISRLAILGIIAGLLNSGVSFLFHTTGVMVMLLWIVMLQKEKEKEESYEKSIA